MGRGRVAQAWRIRLLPDHRVTLHTAAIVQLPITAGASLVKITRFLLGLSPYLDLLDELGAVPGFTEPVSPGTAMPAGGGSASIWPG